jgi:hypothetical protein
MILLAFLFRVFLSGVSVIASRTMASVLVRLSTVLSLFQQRLVFEACRLVRTRSENLVNAKHRSQLGLHLHLFGLQERDRTRRMLVSGCNSTEDMDLLYCLGLESEDDRRHAGNASSLKD